MQGWMAKSLLIWISYCINRNTCGGAQPKEVSKVRAGTVNIDSGEGGGMYRGSHNMYGGSYEVCIMIKEKADENNPRFVCRN